MRHLPVLRGGRPYRSLSTVTLEHLATGEPVAEVSQANPGLIARDLAAAAVANPFDGLSTSELIDISNRAARYFAEEDLPLGDELQSPDDYVRQLSATTGLPEVMVRANMAKSRFVLDEMETVLGGLTRGLDLDILDAGFGVQGGRSVSYRRETALLGAILPSNSPGVHSLWLPAIPLKVGLALKPGSKEPWTPYRICQAFLAAGCPAAALGFYPTDYSGGAEILLRSGRSLLFGDRSTVEPWRGDERVQLHGPGWSKVIFGADRAGAWRESLDLMAASVADNGGRSCINASGVWTSADGRELAEGLAERLAAIEARALDDPAAELAAFPSRAAAEAMSAHLDSQLRIPGAVDLTAAHRSGGRVAEAGGCHFVLPTVVFCEDPEHPLAQSEFLFPFVSVVETAADGIAASIGESLVLTALTDDPRLQSELLHSPHVERLNLGAFPTTRVDWTQPHEGNLFEHLYRQRALQSAAAPAASDGDARQTSSAA